jgi:hypothetical protein
MAIVLYATNKHARGQRAIKGKTREEAVGGNILQVGYMILRLMFLALEI